MRIVIDTRDPSHVVIDAGGETQRSMPLGEIAQRLSSELGTALEPGLLRGKTQMRDAVVDMLDCSVLHAEEVVDALEERGLARFVALEPGRDEETAGEQGTWIIEPPAVEPPAPPVGQDEP